MKKFFILTAAGIGVTLFFNKKTKKEKPGFQFQKAEETEALKRTDLGVPTLLTGVTKK